MQPPQLVGAVPQGVEPQLAVEPQVLEGFAQGIETEALAHGPVVGQALGFGQAGEIAADQHLLQDLWGYRGHRAGDGHGGGLLRRHSRHHGLVLPRQDVIEAGIDGLENELAEAIEELTAVERGEAALEMPGDHAVEGVGLGVGLGGDPGVDDRQHVTGVDPLQGALDALRLLSLVVIDIEIRGIGEVTS